jgi:hypothetical protein
VSPRREISELARRTDHSSGDEPANSLGNDRSSPAARTTARSGTMRKAIWGTSDLLMTRFIADIDAKANQKTNWAAREFMNLISW